MTNKSFSDTDKIFHSDGHRVGQDAADQGLSPEDISNGVKTIQESMDELNEAILRNAVTQGVQVACSKGCDWCCYQPVFANNFEMLHLIRHIRQKLSSTQIGNILKKAAAKNLAVSNLSESKLLRHKAACPLLENGVCTVYEARPMACRIYLSTSLESCRHFFNHPGDKHKYPMLLEFPLRAGRMLNEGFTAAMRQNGQPSREYRLEEGLLLFLQEPGLSSETMSNFNI